MEVRFKARLGRRRPGEVRILSRIATVADSGLGYEADQRQAEILMKNMGIDEGAKELPHQEFRKSKKANATGEK